MSKEVDKFMDDLIHPLKEVVVELRTIMNRHFPELEENIKWSAPNYAKGDIDGVTFKLFPPKEIAIIFHRGAKKLAPLSKRLVNLEPSFIEWKENDRAMTKFK